MSCGTLVLKQPTDIISRRTRIPALMTLTNFSRIEQDIDDFPALPSIVGQVMEVASSPESSASDLMETIQPDPAMCTAILKVANSSLFGQPRKVDSLERAITLLGFKEIECIVLAKAVADSFQSVFSQHGTMIEKFWEHSFACGLAAKIIGSHLNLSSGQFFLGGLIHDIGKLAIMISFPDEYARSGLMNEFSTSEHRRREVETIGICHDQVGAKLLEKWNFPEILLRSTGDHHDPERVSNDTIYPLVIQLADLMAHLGCAGDTDDDLQIIEEIDRQLPEVAPLWQKLGHSWNETAVESWFSWLKIDLDHGSSTLKLLSFS